MIIVLSPAKTLDYGVDPKSNHTAPQFLSQSSNLIKTVKEKEPKDIASLMGLSDKLAALNFDRYQSWKASKIVSADSKPSVMVFKGDVYQGLDAETLNNKQIKFAGYPSNGEFEYDGRSEVGLNNKKPVYVYEYMKGDKQFRVILQF